MRNPNIVIIEDEKPAARSLKRKLEKLGYPVNRLLHSVAQMQQWFSENEEPDLIFLDIQLSDGLSFDGLKEFDVQSAIIFTTAYDQFALRAFEHNSVDYLLKPIHPEKLENALRKFKRNSANNESISMQELRRLFVDPATAYKTRFPIKVGACIKLVESNDIECIYAENKAVYIHTCHGENYVLDYNLDQLEQLLDPNAFFRINRGQIICRNAIKSIAVHSNSRLKIYLHHYTGKELIVSREKIIFFKDWLE